MIRPGSYVAGDEGEALRQRASKTDADASSLTPPPARDRLDEIGTDERLPLPEWEWDWDHFGNAVVGGIGAGLGEIEVRPTRREGDGAGENALSDPGVCLLTDMAGGGILPSTLSGEPSHHARYIHARVSAEGRTRVLLISSHKDIHRTIGKFRARQETMKMQALQCRLVLDKYKM